MIAKKLENADVAWTAIVGASQALKDASATYFASAAGQTNTALTRIFRPGRVYEYGCFNSYWSGGAPTEESHLAFGCTSDAIALTLQASAWPTRRVSRCSAAGMAASASPGRRGCSTAGARSAASPTAAEMPLNLSPQRTYDIDLCLLRTPPRRQVLRCAGSSRPKRTSGPYSFALLLPSRAAPASPSAPCWARARRLVRRLARACQPACLCRAPA